MKKFCVVSLLLVVPLLSMGGCTTIDDARNDKGKGTTRIYKVPFEKVWATVPTAISNLGLSVARENKDEGYVLAHNGHSILSYGENVAVFVEKVDEGQTKVEVVSKKEMVTNILVWNWEKPILDKLSEMLGSK